MRYACLLSKAPKSEKNRYSNNRHFDFPDYSNYSNSTLFKHELKYSMLKLTFRGFQNGKTLECQMIGSKVTDF